MNPDNPTPQQHKPSGGRVVQPLPGQGQPNPAVELIRQKISNLYKDEPDAQQELTESEAAGKTRSKHQQFMHDLSQSGKSLAEIQTAWHNYYIELPDHEKHEVWQEFYTQAKGQPTAAHKPPESKPEPKQPAPTHPKPTKLPKPRLADRRSVTDIKKQLTSKVQTRNRLSTKSHFKSVIFGLSMGAASLVILMFGLFNERFIAPFISPSRTVSSTPIIADPGSGAVGNEPRLIIPKINVDVPVVYDEPSIAEDDVQRALERGVLHYATTPNPGQEGNGVIFGHSSNNLLNTGRYKFAFVLLSRLESGDTFMLEYEGKRYVYRVFDKKVVPPTDLSVLEPTDRPSTMTLITCDPPGTVLNRLAVVAEQISPDPANNVAADINQEVAAQGEPVELPSDAPSLWSRLTGWL